MNDLITKHPMDGVRYKAGQNSDDIHFLTRDEQIRFLEVAKQLRNYNQYALILETSRLRTGGMIGLTWDAIDFQNRTLTVNKTLEYRHKQHFWRAGRRKHSRAIAPSR